MAGLLDWVKQTKLPQVVKSAIFHYEFEFIHPFSDGNGRMGRMWQTLLLYQENPVFAWLPVESIVAHNQQEYYRAIRRSTNNNDSGIFARFMLSAIKQATGEFKEKYLAGKIENTPAKSTQNASVNAGVKLSPTQEKIVALLTDNGNISQVEIAKQLGVNGATVYRNIEKLKQMGLLERKGSDKTGVWMVK